MEAARFSLVIDLVENRIRGFPSSRSAEPLELKIVPWSALKPHIDVFEADGKERTGLFAANNPINYRDPLGLEVDITFNRKTGDVKVRDRDTGKSATGKAFSGNGPYANDSRFESMRDKGPLPGGKYDVLDHPMKDWYSLDKQDRVRDDYDPTTKRSKFRLHEGTGSDGCVTVTSDWDKINEVIKNTKPSKVKDAFGKQRTKYGDLKVE